MKTNIIALMALIWVGLALGQEEIEEITIPFHQLENDQINRDKFNRIERGDYFRIKINGINTYLYKVQFNNEDVDETSDLPSNLLSLISLSGLSDAAASLNSVSSAISRLPDKSEVVESGAEEEFQPEMNFTKEIGDAVALPQKDLERIIVSNEKKVNQFFEEISKLKKQITSLFIEVQEEENKFLTFRGPQIYTPRTEYLLGQFKRLQTETIDFTDGILKYKASFSGTIVANEKSLKEDANKKLNTKASEVIAIYEVLEKVSSNLDEVLSAENFTNISKVLVELGNHTSKSYVSAPIQRYEDVNKLTISVVPHEEKSKLPSFKTTIRIPDYEKDFWGVSTGFYVAKNLEQNFSIKERMSEDQTIVYDFVDEDQSEQEIGINTMIRYGINLNLENKKNWFWQFGFGAGLTINERVKPRLFGGTGLAIGERNKLIFDIGLIFMTYDKLSNAFERTDNLNLPENFLVNASQIRGYISLGYLINLEGNQ